MRAECVRLSLSAAPNLGLASVPGISIADAIADYNSCYRLKQNTSALCEAVILAVNHSESPFPRTTKKSYLHVHEHIQIVIINSVVNPLVNPHHAGC